MAKRVIMDSDASSPLRVSVGGVDADMAEFLNVVFDANQPPLRLYVNGYQYVNGVTYNEAAGGKNTTEGSLVLAAASPVGATPIFQITGLKYNSGLSRPGTVYRAQAGFDGFGAGIVRVSGNNYLIPMAFGPVGSPSFPDGLPGQSAINYVIFKNWA